MIEKDDFMNWYANWVFYNEENGESNGTYSCTGYR